MNLKKVVLIVIVLGVVLLGGSYAGYKGYRHVRQMRLVKQAKGYLEKSEDRKALLCLQRALGINNRDLDATRLMAQLLERAGSPAALIWRSKVVELSPSSTDDRLALAQTALGARDYVSATNALAGVSADGKKTAAYHNIAGALAIAGRELDQAESHFMEAARIDSHDVTPQLNLSVVRLQRTNEQSLIEARATLKRISTNPTNAVARCQALRELAMDAVRYKQPDAALAIASQLLSDTNSLFRDRLLRLEILRVTTNSEYSTALAACEREAGTNTANIRDLATWQVNRRPPAETLAWLRTAC